MEISWEQYEKANAAEYGADYAAMPLLDPAAAAAIAAEREALLAALAGRAEFACLGSKIHTGPLSPGCRQCVAGSWSCLFVNNLCNGRCFYCPTSQSEKSVPATNNLSFPNCQDYLDYLAAFGFDGASVSRGEPLLTFDRTLEFVTRIKKRFGAAIHLWLYSNGILATPEKIDLLQKAGLDEMRFDISADQYRLDHLKLAASRIPTVTVEIPAVPEDYELLRDLLPELAVAGVAHLNLHQLRCTPHNLPQLLARGYVFNHAPKVLVPASELTALRLLRDALGMAAAPAVNYCSFAYKSRFQGQAARLRAALKLRRPHEDVTAAGYLRSLRLEGEAGEIDRLLAQLGGTGEEAGWQRDGRERLLLRADALIRLAWHSLRLQVSYFAPQLRGALSYRGSHQEIALNRKRKIYAERQKVLGPVEISAEEQAPFLALLGGEAEVGGGLAVGLRPLEGYERLPAGLFPYLPG